MAVSVTPAIARFAWPACFVAIAAMGFAYMRDRREPPVSEVRVEHEGATVVRELRALSRLETSSLHLEKVVELADHQKHLRGLVEADDKILFVAAGEVVLGVDLSKLADGDVRSEHGMAYITLPPPEILSTRFDESHSYVHARDTDVLARRNEGLEAAARREAMVAFTKSAQDPRAIESAKAQAEKQLRTLAKAWGANDLVVDWKETRAEL
jgi:hypothetical protein